MNDKLLYSCRPQVREAFAEELFTRLRSLEKGATDMTTPMSTFRLKWQYILIALVIAVTMIFGLSPKARALASVLFQEIAGFSVEEQVENPLKEYFEDEEKLDQLNETAVHIPRSSVDEILSDPPFEFSMPEYIPEGMTLQENIAAVAPSGTWVSINYRGLGIGAIQMMAETGTPVLPIGVDTAEEITINDQMALLVRGDWAKDGSYTWDYEDGLTLYWTVGTTNYRLIFSNMDSVNLDKFLPELIKMAESVH